MIDNLDARMNTLAAALDGVKPGQWTPRIFSMENRQFYKAKGSE
jgi:3'-5' exoribonuclease